MAKHYWTLKIYHKISCIYKNQWKYVCISGEILLLLAEANRPEKDYEEDIRGALRRPHVTCYDTAVRCRLAQFHQWNEGPFWWQCITQFCPRAQSSQTSVWAFAVWFGAIKFKCPSSGRQLKRNWPAADAPLFTCSPPTSEVGNDCLIQQRALAMKEGTEHAGCWRRKQPQPAMSRWVEPIVTCLLSITLLPPLLILLAILRLGKWLLDSALSPGKDCVPFREDDAVWLQDRPTNRHIINALMLLEGPPMMEKLREVIADRLVFCKDDRGQRRWPRLAQVIETGCGRSFWKEDVNFNMANHVKHWQGRLPSSLAELEGVISEICNTKLPEEISPWEFLVIAGTLEDVHAVVLRMHHCVADGVAVTRIFGKNMFDVPPHDKEPYKFTMKQRAYMWCKAAFVGAYMVLTKFLVPADQSPVHGQQLSGKKLVSWSKTVDLALVKRVKNLTGTTVNDVMVSCVAGAMGEYLTRECGVGNPQDMLASVPVDIRSTANSMKLQNKFALVFLQLPLAARSGVDRLLATKRRMDVIKTSAEPLVTATTVKLLMLLPEFISKPLVDFFSMKMSCVLSNVPGPQTTLSIGGQRVLGGIFWPPQRATIGIGLSIFSYAGKMRVGIFSDESVIPNPRAFVEAFERQFEELLKELNLSEDKVFC